MDEKEEMTGREIDEAELTDEEKAEMRLFIPAPQSVIIPFDGMHYRLKGKDLSGTAISSLMRGQFSHDLCVQILVKITGMAREQIAEQTNGEVYATVVRAIGKLAAKIMGSANSPLAAGQN